MIDLNARLAAEAVFALSELPVPRTYEQQCDAIAAVYAPVERLASASRVIVGAAYHAIDCKCHGEEPVCTCGVDEAKQALMDYNAAVAALEEEASVQRGVEQQLGDEDAAAAIRARKTT